MNWLFDSPSLFVVFASVFGLIVGSFLNVVIYRLPKMMERQWRQECHDCFPDEISAPEGKVFNLSLPRSHCPACQHPVTAIDNVPVLSWLVLGGKCRHCKTPISKRYPLIELLTAVLAGTTAFTLTGSYWSLAAIFATFVLFSLCFIDMDTMLLPDQMTLPLMWAGILLAVVGVSPVSLEDAVIGAMAGYLSLWSVYQLFRILTGKEGMGYGDFKLLAALGAWLGWQTLPMVILLASFVGAIGGIALMRINGTGKETPFSFGPYLAIAGWIGLLWGDKIIHWYLTSYLGY
ncbi:prepilin peptidase [Enterovibrio nigricans]|uniref:Prepilin leader peptidase/N-methyltransferase n=1 Tax=Enterovibrio nigricans DSM 22720 TaxID=1121868 RepID=A0A1T4TXB6_9GAMM|nr:A24 family peptidase [Enterovibrio nigricans]PKF51441.1 prepilin peptidase [Enterovibrio nigricans]SKA45080.1 leader peptidase (prepilin peptidase) / N-methyltransferase [Enterovibrio nigricans DSM 22720]